MRSRRLPCSSFTAGQRTQNHNGDCQKTECSYLVMSLVISAMISRFIIMIDYDLALLYSLSVVVLFRSSEHFALMLLINV